MTALLFAFTGALSQAACGYAIRSIQARSRNLYTSVASNYAAALALAIAYCIWRGTPEAWLNAVLIGVPGGIFYTLALLALIRSMGQRGLAITSAFAGMSLMIPVLIAIIWGERPAILQGTGILLAASAIPPLSLATARGTAIRERPSIRMVILLFVLQGAAMSSNLIAFKVVAKGSIPIYLVALFGAGFVLSLLLWRLKRQPSDKGDVRRGVIFGSLNIASTLIIVTALGFVSGALFFPAMGVIGLALAALVGIWLWNERIRPWGWIGLFLAGASILLLNLSSKPY